MQISFLWLATSSISSLYVFYWNRDYEIELLKEVTSVDCYTALSCRRASSSFYSSFAGVLNSPPIFASSVFFIEENLGLFPAGGVRHTYSYTNSSLSESPSKFTLKALFIGNFILRSSEFSLCYILRALIMNKLTYVKIIFIYKFR